MLEANAKLIFLMYLYNMQSLQIDDILGQFGFHMLEDKDSGLDELQVNLIPVILVDLFRIVLEIGSDFGEERLAVVQLPDVGMKP